MKYLNTILSFFLVLVALSSCQNLDAPITKDLTKHRIDELLESSDNKKNIIAAEMRGIYDHIYKYMNNARRVDDERGLTSVMLTSDMTGLDLVDGNRAWFRFDYQLDNHAPTYRRTNFLWNFFFKQITKANLVVSTYFPDMDNLNDVEKALYAELRTVRGYSYYYLVNLYQHTYKGHENEPAVPILRTPEDEGAVRNTVKEVYDFLIEDLKYGVENGVSTPEVADLDKNVAAHYLALAYATMENWAEAKKYAEIAVGKHSLELPDNFAEGFASLGSPGVVWGFEVTSDNALIWPSWFAMMDNTLGMYTSSSPKKIYKPLYDKISDTDKRKNWWVPEGEEAAKAFIKKVGRDVDGGELASVKFMSPSNVEGDYIYLRAANSHLLMIEAMVELGETDQARAALNEFMKKRDPEYDINTVTDLRDEVRLQRRIELWGEGVQFYDIKRWGLGIDRNQPGSNHTVRKTIAPGADVPFVYSIPMKEQELHPDWVN